MIRVGHFFEGPPIVGVGISVKKLVDRLDRDRFEPVMIASEPGEFVNMLNNSGYEVKILNCSVSTQVKKMLSSKSRDPLCFVHLCSQMVKNARRLRKLLYEENINILHTHHHQYHVLSALACKKDIRNVWHIRGIINPKWRFRIEGRIFNYCADKYASHIIAISEAVRESMSQKVQKKISVFYNGIEAGRFSSCSAGESKKKLGFDPDTILVGAVGRFICRKGFHDFISMAEIVASKHEDVHFILIGPDDIPEESEYRNLCLQQIERSHLTERFTIKGSLREASVFMPALDLLVHPMTMRWEGFGNVVLEAQACGIPVITTDCGGPTEIIIDGQTGFVVAPQDFNAMAKHVSKLLSNKELAEQMGRSARARASEAQFSITNTVRQVERIYLSILGR